MAQSGNGNLKLSYGQYESMLLGDRSFGETTFREVLVPLLELFKAGAENWLLGNVLAQFFELPEALHLPVQSAGVNLAFMIGVYLRNYVQDDMYGLNPAKLAERLKIKVHQARGLLSGQCQIDSNGHLAWKAESQPRDDQDSVILHSGINLIQQRLLCSEEDARRLVGCGVHTPRAALALGVLEGAMIGYLLNQVGLGEVGNELGRYVLAGTGSFIAAKTTTYFAGCASNLYRQYVSNTSSFSDPLLANNNGP